MVWRNEYGEEWVLLLRGKREIGGKVERKEKRRKEGKERVSKEIDGEKEKKSLCVLQPKMAIDDRVQRGLLAFWVFKNGYEGFFLSLFSSPLFII